MTLPHPSAALSDRQIEAVLYLADRMAFTDRQISAPERGMVDLLARQAGRAGFREQDWYQRLSDDGACERLNTSGARQAAMLVMGLVLRSDLKQRAEECAYYREINAKLGSAAVTFPPDLDEHRRQAMAAMGR
jgi:hypothetical protein